MKKYPKFFVNLICCFVPKKKNRHHIREKYTNKRSVCVGGGGGKNSPCRSKNIRRKKGKAVLLIFFNRPDDTKCVFEQIRIAQPSRLYLACDGARKFVDGEAELVNNLRNEILSLIDWPCEVHTLFRDKNIGCGPSCSGAITWFFENEECGIIFEDDCVPCQSFFKFCDELLDKYRNNKEIWGISGNNSDKNCSANETYLFTRLTSGWGWATWKDRWDQYNFNLTGWNDNFINEFHPAKKVRRFYKRIFEQKKEGD